MKLLLATDAWRPQINGVVRTLTTVMSEIEAMGHEVHVISPSDYPTFPLPTYPEIKIAYWMKGIVDRIESFDPDAIHISTEGPIGSRVRRYCLSRGYRFTTAYHTKFPEYINERFPIPASWIYPIVRRFHGAASRTLVPTKTLKQDLENKGFDNLRIWGRGVDTRQFHPGHRDEDRVAEYQRPIMVSVGRVAVEKNLEAFLELDVPGTKVIVGDGPALEELRTKYPDAVFPGMKHGEDLAAWYADADVFVFPSLTDTFGLVILEALACGTPVAAFPVTGPLDVLEPGVSGIMHDDLAIAIDQALKLDRQTCVDFASNLSWNNIANAMLQAYVPLNSDKTDAISEAQWVSPDTPA